MLFLFEPPSTSTTVLTLWSTTLLVVSGINFWNRETKRRLREQVTGLQATLSDAQTTLSLATQAKELREEEAKRLALERDDFIKEITTLKGQRNLDGLRQQVNDHHSEVMETLKRETLAIQLRVTETLKENNREILKGFSAHADKDNEMLHAIADSQAQAAAAQLQTAAALSSMNLRLDALASA